MLDKIIKELIVSFWEQENYQILDREIKIPQIQGKKVISLVGPRRSGKTSLCFLKIKELLNKGISKKNILYFNFEDERLLDFSIKDFDILLKSYFELSGKSTKDKDIYFFFDEIQNISGWEKFIVRLLNSFDIKVVVTGSSAKMLSKEINTALRGRNLSFEVLPLDFKEYLRFQNVKIDKNFEYSIDAFNFYKKLIKDFISFGAFPEVVLEKNENIKILTLKDYYDLIFYKDIVDRYSIRDISALKKFRKVLTYNFTEFISLKNISKQYNIAYQSLLNWFEYFQDVYFGFALKNFSFALKDVERSIAKFYLVDTGLFYANFGEINEKNLSRLFENMVFLELRKAGFIENESIFYYRKNNFDIDFILLKKGKIIPVQVSYELNDINFEREYLQLENLIEKYNLEKGYLIIVENKLRKKMTNKKIELLYLQDIRDKLNLNI